MRDNMSLFETRGLTKKFGNSFCLKDITFKINHGDIFSIAGINGSGKTVILDLISGFIKPDSGILILNGNQCNNYKTEWFSSNGLIRIFQTPRVFEQTTIEECLMIACWAPFWPKVITNLFRPKKYIEKIENFNSKIDKILDRLNWQKERTKKAGNLSYGERKLLAMAQLYLTNGTLAVCDEPTAGLDKFQSHTAFQLLLEWKNKKGDRSILFTTHDLDFTRRYANQTYRISNGLIKKT